MTMPTDNDRARMRVTHIGGPTALIEIGTLRLLTDPTFEPGGYSYSAGGQEIRKTADPAITAAALGSVDVVLLSHDQHGDNLDPAGRAYLAEARQTLTTPEGARRLGGNTRGVATWETVEVAGADGLAVRITATPARHGPEQVAPLAGHVTGWLLEWDGQRRGAVYLSGDTVLFEGVEEVAHRGRVSVALLNFGAARAQRFGPFDITFTGDEGAQVARLLGDATIIPLHYEGWSHFSQGRAEVEQAFAAAGLTERLRVLPIGQPVTLDV
ncbi:MAG TPA: MBL fold metallo-hydrolase [Ktedonobacterales bacterium]|nr:MBL fold metallo-hydrolase [Ktedonobacterales bacterium]